MATDLNKPTTWGLTHAVAVVPNDTIDLHITARGLWITGQGNLAVIMAGDPDNGAVILQGVAAGPLFDLYIRRILATGTTCSGIIALN